MWASQGTQYHGAHMFMGVDRNENYHQKSLSKNSTKGLLTNNVGRQEAFMERLPMKALKRPQGVWWVSLSESRL